MAGGGRRGWRVAGEMDTQGEVGRLWSHGAGYPEALLAVGLEHVGETETLTADLARVRLLSGVGAPVSLHVGSTGETLPADFADERLLT